MNGHKDHNFFRYLLICLHLFMGVNGLIGGLLLMLKPDGSYLQMDSSWISQSVFSNFFIPGFLLFSFVGLLSSITLYGLVSKKEFLSLNKLNLYKDKHWAWTYSLYSGIISIIWINVQLILTSYFWLQPLIIFIGIAILICTLIPNVMHYYSFNKSSNE